MDTNLLTGSNSTITTEALLTANLGATATTTTEVMKVRPKKQLT